MRGKFTIFNLVFGALGALLVLFVVLPLAATVLGSPLSTLWQTLLDPEVLKSIAVTFLAGAIATGAALLTGVPLAYLLARRRFAGKQLIEGVINLPVVIPHTAAGIALLMVFGRYGIFGKMFAPLGITFTDSLAGIVVAMLFVSLPFLVLMSREAFALLDPEYELVALADGAGPWQAFWHVALPQAWRGVLGGAVMMWARGISEFGAVVILAYHPKIVPVLVYERFAGFGLDAAQPVAAILILVALLAFGLLRLALIPRRQD